MSVLDRSLSIMGERQFIPTRELLTALWPTMLQGNNDSLAYRDAALMLSHALGPAVKPHSRYIPRPGQRGRYVNGYRRADLEFARTAPSGQELKPYRPVLDWQRQYGMTDESEAQRQSRPPYRV